jgi:threonylcarbamoyladenosine tRNA methylthiotransferase MtaB
MNQFKKVAFYTLGCKLNFAETSTISRLFENDGFAKVDFNDTPDVFVINTCSVTENADRKCRNVVRRALKVNPKAFVAIVGCYAQLKPEVLAGIKGVDVVLGANEKFNILEHLNNLEKQEIAEQHFGEIKYVKDFIPGFSSGDRTRTFLKVQDGCDYFCSFCTIPLARGRSRSANIEETIKVAQEVAKTEAREVVLTGVNIGDFGSGTDENFFGLVKELDKIEGIDRFRISSIEPNLLSNEIIDFVAQSNKFTPHFHIPLQSGDDSVLKDMRRRYDTELFRNRIEHIKRIMPNACIGIDVIVGFPGETDELFLKTVDFLNSLPFSYLHVFTYSERANTTAVRKIDDIVPMPTRHVRSKQLQMLSLKHKRAFYTSQKGKKGKALLESENHEDYLHGFTENYIKVKVPYNESLINTFVEVEHQDFDSEGLMDISILELQNS